MDSGLDADEISVFQCSQRTRCHQHYCSHILGLNLALFEALSRSSLNMLATTGDNGDPSVQV